jgi:hypothetical protein
MHHEAEAGWSGCCHALAIHFVSIHTRRLQTDFRSPPACAHIGLAVYSLVAVASASHTDMVAALAAGTLHHPLRAMEGSQR